MASTRAPPRRFKRLFTSNKITPYTAALDEEFQDHRLSGTLTRPYNPDIDHELRERRAGSNISDFDNVEFRVRQERVDLTFIYPDHDIEMPTASQLRRMPPQVRRTIRPSPQTPYKKLYYSGPAVAPSPRIPDPLDDKPEWGFRDTYMYRPKAAPDGEEEPKRAKKRKELPSRSESEESQDSDSDSARGQKRPRRVEVQTATRNQGQASNSSHFMPTPAATPNFASSRDIPIPTTEHTDDEVAANLALLAAYNNARPPPSTSTRSAAPSSRPAPPPPLPGRPEFAEHGFLALPPPVRRQVYRHLLVRAEPVRVHAS